MGGRGRKATSLPAPLNVCYSGSLRSCPLPITPLSSQVTTQATQASTLFHCVLTGAECETNLCTAFDYWYIVYIFILKLPKAATSKWKSHCSN